MIRGGGGPGRCVMPGQAGRSGARVAQEKTSIVLATRLDRYYIISFDELDLCPF